MKEYEDDQPKNAASFEEVLNAALQLPPEMRVALVDHLTHSLGTPIPEEIEQAWAEEAERRMQEIRDGKVELIDGNKVMEELRARFK